MASSSSGDADDRSQPAGSPAPGPTSGAGAGAGAGGGAGAAAQEAVDLDAEEGLPGQRAWFRVAFGPWGDGGGGIRVSSPVAVLTLTAGLVAGGLWFAVEMRESVYAGWIMLGVVLSGIAIMGAGGWFAYWLARHERPHVRRFTVVRDPNEPLTTSTKALPRGRRKPKTNNRRHGHNRRGGRGGRGGRR